MLIGHSCVIFLLLVFGQNTSWGLFSLVYSRMRTFSLLFVLGFLSVFLSRRGIPPQAILLSSHVASRCASRGLGDLLSQSRGDGGLGVGSTLTSALFLGAIFLIVTFLSMTRKDAAPRKAAVESHVVDAQTLRSGEMMEAVEVQGKQGQRGAP